MVSFQFNRPICYANSIGHVDNIFIASDSNIVGFDSSEQANYEPIQVSQESTKVARSNSFSIKKDTQTELNNSTQSSWLNSLTKYFWNPLSGIIIGIFVAVFGALLYDRLNRRIHIRVLHKKKTNSIEELHGLYLQQINPIERISPIYITNCLNTPHLCAKNRHDLIERINTNPIPPIIHILIVAKTKGEIVGFIKSLYVTSIKTLFIAYVAVQPGEASTERRTMRKLLAKLQKFTNKDGPVSWIIFEITLSNESSTLAKDRLFRHHGQTFGLEIRQIDINYFQPDLDCIDLQQCNEESARLYIASTHKIPSHLEISFVRRLIEAIYLDIYVPTWLVNHDEKDQPALEKYVRDLADLSLSDVSEKISLL